MTEKLSSAKVATSDVLRTSDGNVLRAETPQNSPLSDVLESRTERYLLIGIRNQKSTFP